MFYEPVIFFSPRFISTVGIDFREKKITWRGPKHENGEKLVQKLFIKYGKIRIVLIGTKSKNPASVVGYSGSGKIPESNDSILSWRDGVHPYVRLDKWPFPDVYQRLARPTHYSCIHLKSRHCPLWKQGA